jgi:hypothetical protein
MKRRVTKWSALVLILFVGCAEDTEDDVNNNDVPGSDGEVDTDSGTDDDGTVFQPEVAIEIINETATPKYIDNLFGIPPITGSTSPVHVGPVEDAGMQPYWVRLPVCGMLYCSDSGPDSASCCVDCGGGPPDVQVIAPGESMTMYWDGMLGAINDTYCDECACYDREAPQPGPHRIELCTHESAGCKEGFEEACTSVPTTTGSHDEISVVGEPSCYTVDFDVPYASEHMTLAISEGATDTDRRNDTDTDTETAGDTDTDTSTDSDLLEITQMCQALDDTGCSEHPSCAPIVARPVDAENRCLGAGEAVGCSAAYRACDDALTVGEAPDGSCWFFTDLCLPSDFIDLEAYMGESDTSLPADPAACGLEAEPGIRAVFDYPDCAG